MGSGVPGGARDSTASAVKADAAAEVRESGKINSLHIDKTGGLTKRNWAVHHSACNRKFTAKSSVLCTTQFEYYWLRTNI